MRLLCVSDEKLRLVGVGTRISHGDNAASVELQEDESDQNAKVMKQNEEHL